MWRCRTIFARNIAAMNLIEPVRFTGQRKVGAESVAILGHGSRLVANMVGKIQ
jgi:hypothetical protein